MTPESPYNYKLGFDPRTVAQEMLASGAATGVMVPSLPPRKPNYSVYQRRPELDKFGGDRAGYLKAYRELTTSKHSGKSYAKWPQLKQFRGDINAYHREYMRLRRSGPIPC